MKRKSNKMRISEDDYLRAHRRAARLEEIALHGKLVSLRSLKHETKKVYNRKRLRKIRINLIIKQGDD